MRRASLALVALLAVAPALVAASCSSEPDGVAVDEVRRATVTEVVDAPASVTARAVATLTAPADGTLDSLTVEPGTTVAKDAVIAVVDSPAAQQRLADAEAALAIAGRATRGIRPVDFSAAQRGLDEAAADAFQAARAAAEKVSDESSRAALLAQVDAAQRHYETTTAGTRQLLRQVEQGLAGISQAVTALGAAQKAQAQVAYDLAAATVDALTLRAPIAGVVQFARPASASAVDPLAALLGSVGGSAASGATSDGTAGGAASGVDQGVAGIDDIIAVGDPVRAGTAIVTIVDVSEIGLVAEVDETDVLLVTPGVAADVELDAAPGLRFEATVGTVDVLPTPSTAGGVAYRIRLAFRAVDPGPDGQTPATPRPGMSAVAHLRVRTAIDALAVPAGAVFSGPDGDAVWLVRDGRAVRVPVTVGVTGEDLVEIVAGLELGQRIVVTGADRVSEGQELPA